MEGKILKAAGAHQQGPGNTWKEPGRKRGQFLMWWEWTKPSLSSVLQIKGTSKLRGSERNLKEEGRLKQENTWYNASQSRRNIYYCEPIWLGTEGTVMDEERIADEEEGFENEEEDEENMWKEWLMRNKQGNMDQEKKRWKTIRELHERKRKTTESEIIGGRGRSGG
jgi:hypothetical protein